MKTPDIIIAIDPDVDGSGVAILNPEERILRIEQFTLPVLVDYLRTVKPLYDRDGIDYVVVVEASWKIRGNWHLEYNDSRNRAAAKGQRVGRNHEIGRQIVEFCKHLDVPYEEKLPLVKCWAGKDGKITHEELMMLIDGMSVSITNMSGKMTNQEKLDAALLALDRSGLPLILVPRKSKDRPSNKHKNHNIAL